MLLQRMLRAARLDPELYYEVTRDRTANGQAFAVILIVLACSLVGVGALSPAAFLRTGMCTVGGWLFWSMIAMLVGTRFRGRAEFDEVIRPVAFANAPGVLYALGLVPGWSLWLMLGVWLWVTVATFVAIREALHLAAREAALTMLFTFLIVQAISFVTGTTFSMLGMLLTRLGL